MNLFRQIMAFKEANAGKLGSAERAVDQAIEQTRANIAWLDRYYDDILEAMVKHLPHTILCLFS